MKALMLAVALSGTSAITGCASIVSGTNQPIAVETRLNGDALTGASCRLSSNKGTWFVQTPGSIVVHRGFQDLAVECAKAGLPTAFTSVASSTKAMAFGNILFGGVIGVGVDVGTGAAYDYPPLISVEMGSNADASPATAEPTVSRVTGPEPIVVTAYGDRPVVAAAPSIPAPTLPSNEKADPRPTSEVVVSTAATTRRQMKYQVSAETFARTQACSATPFATLATWGPGSETYTIPCASGEALIARCDYGNCRAMR